DVSRGDLAGFFWRGVARERMSDHNAVGRRSRGWCVRLAGPPGAASGVKQCAARGADQGASIEGETDDGRAPCKEKGNPQGHAQQAAEYQAQNRVIVAVVTHLSSSTSQLSGSIFSLDRRRLKQIRLLVRPALVKGTNPAGLVYLSIRADR